MSIEISSTVLFFSGILAMYFDYVGEEGKVSVTSSRKTIGWVTLINGGLGLNRCFYNNIGGTYQLFWLIFILAGIHIIIRYKY
ncbi:MAG: hypothetical protein COT91_03985 [Candidatus Doudnabacteria bacterium CG10_big_fil_rev_8_21_14_0_10_41_10]|uniref:Uncharacterized protein n=1 Tax=Candidatus Doudnabacteria bacterium CG10_big_fil_rev_8_21_14_0_10_41_10 TaxID=1974551 RepID=A0A2H0VF48_9BACT|nr:MAG: hypothetical protein COT91_03985 [Candidatus Doudnabacteria bacterium CG10_big_fil_rev_8_21_14_0_10_41_10]